MLTKGIRSVSSSYVRGVYFVRLTCGCKLRMTIKRDGRNPIKSHDVSCKPGTAHVNAIDAWARYCERNP